LDLLSQARATEAKISKCNYLKLNSFFTAKKKINKRKSQYNEQEKILTNISDKRLTFKICKELTQFNTNKQPD